MLQTARPLPVSLLSQSITNLTPQSSLSLSLLLFAFSYSITVTTQGLNRRLVQHKAKLSCCSNTFCTCVSPRTFELKMDLAIPWSYCLAIFILQILVDLVDLVDILVDFLRHLVLHFLLSKGNRKTDYTVKIVFVSWNCTKYPLLCPV